MGASVATSRRRPSGGHTRAFIVEALLLAGVLAFSLSVLMQMFGLAASRAVEARDLTEACLVAQDAAERFCASPADMPAESLEGAFRTVCVAEPVRQEAGTLWRARIEVWDARDVGTSDPLCVLSTARFVEGGR